MFVSHVSKHREDGKPWEETGDAVHSAGQEGIPRERKKNNNKNTSRKEQGFFFISRFPISKLINHPTLPIFYICVFGCSLAEDLLTLFVNRDKTQSQYRSLTWTCWTSAKSVLLSYDNLSVIAEADFPLDWVAWVKSKWGHVLFNIL